MSVPVLSSGKLIPGSRGRHLTRICPSDELIVVLQGELEMFEEDKKFCVCANEYLFLKRGRRHGGLGPYPPNLSFCWVHFIDDGSVMADIPQQGRLRNHSALPLYAQAFLTEQSSLSPDKESLELLFQLMLREIRRPAGLPDPSQVTPLAAAAHQFLELHCTEELTLELIAGELHCNAKYLGQLFHRTYGETIAATLNRLRIDKARKMLASGNLSIKETALACGYNDLAYFRRKFKQLCSVTPKEFRRQYLLGRWLT